MNPYSDRMSKMTGHSGAEENKPLSVAHANRVDDGAGD